MKLSQQNYSIRNAETADAKILSQWWNDGKVMEHAGYPHGLGTTPEKVKSQLEKGSDEEGRLLIIEIDDFPVGEMNYHNVGKGTASIGIKICDFSKQNRGAGTVFLKMLIDCLFQDLGYSKIVLDTNLENKRAQYVYEKIGFQKVRVNYDSFKNQLGEWQSAIDYELKKENRQSGG